MEQAEMKKGKLRVESRESRGISVVGREKAQKKTQKIER